MLQYKEGWVYFYFLEVLNLLKAVAAMDKLDGFDSGNRFLILEDDATRPKETILIAIPDDRGTLYYEGILFDWFGHEVEIDPQIKRIVRPFGYSIGKPNDILNYRDNFIVELNNGRLAIIGLNYRHQKPSDPSYSGTRFMATGNTLHASPYLRFDDSVITYESIDFDSVKTTCLRELSYDDEYPLDAIGQLPNSDQYVFLSSNVRHSISSNGFFVHHIVQSREALVGFFNDPEYKSKKTTHPPTIFSQTTLCGGFNFTEDGNKVTVDFSYINYPKPIKASLDLETLKLRRKNHLYWYMENES